LANAGGRKNIRIKLISILNRLGQRLKLSMPLDIFLAREAYANTHKRAETNPSYAVGVRHAQPANGLQ